MLFAPECIYGKTFTKSELLVLRELGLEIPILQPLVKSQKN